MANLNARHTEFLNDLKIFTTNMKNLFGEAHDLSKRFKEEFDSEKDNCLGDCENLETMYNFDCTDVSNAIDGIDAFINFWTGNAVETKEYGEDFRRVN